MALVEGPDGWYDPNEPKACRTCGGAFVPRGYIRGYSLRAWWYCLRPDHVGDEASRYTYKGSQQESAPENLNSPDHGLMGR